MRIVFCFTPQKNFDMKKNWTDLRHLLHFIALRFKQDRCAQMAASLTFTTLLSLVPLITIALTLSTAFPVFDDFLGTNQEFSVEQYDAGNRRQDYFAVTWNSLPKAPRS